MGVLDRLRSVASSAGTKAPGGVARRVSPYEEAKSKAAPERKTALRADVDAPQTLIERASRIS